MSFDIDELRLIYIVLGMAFPLVQNPMRKRITPLQIKITGMIGAIESQKPAASDHSGSPQKGKDGA